MKWVLKQKTNPELAAAYPCSAQYVKHTPPLMGTTNQKEAKRFATKMAAMVYKEENGIHRFWPVKLVPKKTNHQYVIAYVTTYETWYVNNFGNSDTNKENVMKFYSFEEADTYRTKYNLSEWSVIKLANEKRFTTRVNNLKEYQRGYNDALNDMKKHINTMETK